MKKRILALLLAGALSVGLAACGGDKADAGTSNPGTSTNPGGNGGDEANQPVADDFDGVKEIVVGISADIKTWEPWGSFNVARQNQAPLIYQNLTADVVNMQTGTMDHYLVLAETIDNLGDGTYRIKLREGITDSAGNPFTAEDAIFSFQTCKDLGRLSQVNPIKEMVQEDDLTFTMSLTVDTVGTFDDICNAINMVTKEAYEASPDGMQTNPVGTAPFVLDSYDSGNVKFVKADHYWNDAANESKDPNDGYCSMWDFTNIDVVRYEYISDASTMALALEGGEIDIARAIADDDVVLYEGDSKYSLFCYPEGNYSVCFNVADGHPTSNINLRLAIAYALNSETILDLVADGDGSVAKAWSYPTFLDYQSAWDSQDYFEYDLDLAKDYLAKYCEEAGVSASSLVLKIMYQNEDFAEKTATAVQAALIELTGNGNCTDLKTYDRATFTEGKKTGTDYDIVIQNGQLITRMYSGYEWDAETNYDKLGYTIFHDTDSKRQELLMAAIEVATWSDETVAAYQDYLNEQCYMKNLFYCNEWGLAASWVGNLDKAAGAKSCLNLGALSYNWSASGK